MTNKSIITRIGIDGCDDDFILKVVEYKLDGEINKELAFLNKNNSKMILLDNIFIDDVDTKIYNGTLKVLDENPINFIIEKKIQDRKAILFSKYMHQRLKSEIEPIIKSKYTKIGYTKDGIKYQFSKCMIFLTQIIEGLYITFNDTILVPYHRFKGKKRIKYKAFLKETKIDISRESLEEIFRLFNEYIGIPEEINVLYNKIKEEVENKSIEEAKKWAKQNFVQYAEQS